MTDIPDDVMRAAAALCLLASEALDNREAQMKAGMADAPLGRQ